ncbi:MAG: EAL domain-containing protein, partial [Proteobacteria bacterium]|nr:EAL domain-containing protein [Pseudomonadota bacterium]
MIDDEHLDVIDLLKIDREFMVTMSDNEDYLSIVQTIIILAHHIGMRVTVEGVEDADQIQPLIDFGCDYGQGFYFSKPFDADTAKKLIEGIMDDGDKEDRDEVLAKLRSLMSGIDVLVDKSRFSGERILDGSEIILAGGARGATQEFNLQNFLTFGEDSLELTRLIKDANIASFEGPGAHNSR